MVDDDLIGAFVSGSVGFNDRPDSAFTELLSERFSVFEDNLGIIFLRYSLYGISVVLQNVSV